MRWYRWGWWHLGFILMFCAKRLLPEEGKVENEPYERADNYRQFIVLKALMFTWVNILWPG